MLLTAAAALILLIDFYRNKLHSLKACAADPNQPVPLAAPLSTGTYLRQGSAFGQPAEPSGKAGKRREKEKEDGRLTFMASSHFP